MTNIVMITKDRRPLLLQALRTLFDNTDPATYNLTLIDDGSGEPVPNIFSRRENAVVVRVGKSRGIVGLARNLGASISKQYWGRGDHIYFSDDDVAFDKNWLPVMTGMLEQRHPLLIVGGYRHPYHKGYAVHGFVGSNIYLETTDAVAGYSMLMTWSVWDLYGPFDANAIGTGQSEDYALCRRGLNDILRSEVGYICPPVIHVCGVTNSEGRPAIGSEAIPKVEGLTYL